MPLLDWFRGRSAGDPPEGDSRSPEAEHVEARRHVQEGPGGAAAPEGADDAAAESREDEEARDPGF